MLRLLQGNGRLSNAELAQLVERRQSGNMSPPYPVAVRARLHQKRSRDDCAAKGRQGRAGHGRRRSRSFDTESFAAFEKAVAKLIFILDCHLVAGDFDYFLKIRVKDMADFNRIHGDQLIALPGVRQTRTFFVMKEVVDNVSPGVLMRQRFVTKDARLGIVAVERVYSGCHSPVMSA